MQGDIKKEFALPWDYVGEIERSNKGSTTRLKVARPLEGSLPMFEGLYISVNNLKEGLLRGYRTVLGLDGCFLKRAIKREVLVVVGRDGNNQIFPVAWCVVDCERRVKWEWFLKLLTKDLGLRDGISWTVITD